MRLLFSLLLCLLALNSLGCGGDSTNEGTFIEQQTVTLGGIRVDFQDVGQHGRFLEANTYRLRAINEVTNTEPVAAVVFNRNFTQFDQSVAIGGLETNFYTVVLEALNGTGSVVGEARVDGVRVMGNATTVIDGTSLSLTGTGTSAGTDFTGTNAPDANAAVENITVTVSAGTTPTYTFTGGPVRDISVLALAPGDTSEETLVWGASAVSSDALNSPIAHGPQPAGAQLLTSTAQTVLNPGRNYRVVVVRSNGEFGRAEFAR